MKKARFLFLVVVLALTLSACQVVPNFSWQLRGGRDTLVHYCGGVGCAWQLTFDNVILWPR